MRYNNNNIHIFKIVRKVWYSNIFSQNNYNFSIWFNFLIKIGLFLFQLCRILVSILTKILHSEYNVFGIFIFSFIPAHSNIICVID